MHSQAEAASEDFSGDGTESDAPHCGRSIWWCLAMPVAALLILTARVVHNRWVPMNDRVFVQLRVLDVFGRDTPLVGMPSTLSASGGSLDGTSHHLGPGQFWLLAAPFRIVSSLTNWPGSLAVAAGIVSMAILVAVVWCLRNLGCSLREGLMACGLISAAIWQATPHVAISPWNPDFAFMMLIAATTVCLAITARGPTLASVVAVVVFASLAAQAHLSYVLPSLAIVVVTFVYSSRSGPVDLARWIPVVAAASVVVWAGPIVDLVANSGGNIATLASASDAPGTGVVSAFDRFAHSIAPWQHGLRQPRDGEDFLFTATWSDRLFGVVTIGAVAAIMALRGRVRRLAITTLALTIATMASAAIAPMTLGTVFAAHIQRVWIVPTLLVWTTLTVGLIRLVRPHFPSGDWHSERSLGVVGAGAAVALLASASWSGFEGGTMQLQCSEAVRSLASEVATSARDGDIFDSTAVPFIGLGPAQDLTTGLYGELNRRGIRMQLIADVDRDMISDHYFAAGTRPESGSTITVSPVPPAGLTDGTLLATASCQTTSDFAEVWVWRHASG